MILPHEFLTHENTRDIAKRLPHTRTIIDVGPGIIPCPVFPCDRHILIEPCEEYVDHLKEWRPSDRAVQIIKGEAEAISAFPKSDTTVLMLDVIEHMEKPRAEKIRDLLQKFEHAVVFTPLGLCERAGNNPDDWGLNGGEWQKHLSTWFPEDFPGWNVTVWETFKGRCCGAILAIR